MKVGGNDRMLVTGLGPVGLAAAMLGRALGSPFIIGTDISPERRQLALRLKLVDVALPADGAALDEIKRLTQGRGCEVAVDCSGVGAARLLALQVGTGLVLFSILQVGVACLWASCLGSQWLVHSGGSKLLGRRMSSSFNATPC